MTKMAFVWMLELSDEQRAVVNAKGWGGSIVGKLYMGASSNDPKGIKEAFIAGLYKKKAVVTADNANEVWQLANSFEKSWLENSKVMPLVDKARSMMVGDLIIWDNGKIESVASFGFETLQEGF